MYRHEAAWHDLMDRIARAVSRYLVAQLDAGAQLVQLFDSWVGCLAPTDYARYVLPHSRTAMAEALMETATKPTPSPRPRPSGAPLRRTATQTPRAGCL
jgi:uroporphyrinogen-III decarboxylase